MVMKRGCSSTGREAARVACMWVCCRYLARVLLLLLQRHDEVNVRALLLVAIECRLLLLELELLHHILRLLRRQPGREGRGASERAHARVGGEQGWRAAAASYE